MEESVTYQAILRKGAVLGEAQGRRDEVLRIIRNSGRKKFGPPAASIETAIASIEDVERLERIIDRLVDATPTSWADLLATP
jgi:hypothetical protein